MLPTPYSRILVRRLTHPHVSHGDHRQRAKPSRPHSPARATTRGRPHLNEEEDAEVIDPDKDVSGASEGNGVVVSAATDLGR